jgi:hypothetical protein
MRVKQPSPDHEWRYINFESRFEHVSPLVLYWELDGDPMTDDWLVDEISAAELWTKWRREYPKDRAVFDLFGPGAARIYWYVGGASTFDGAPFQDHRGQRYPGSNFLDHFTWPVSAEDGTRVRWPALPVADKLWRTGRADKGGFIQELTGWKPSPMQPFISIPQLEGMAGLQ